MFDDLLEQVFQRFLLEAARLKVERSELGVAIISGTSLAVRLSCNLELTATCLNLASR